MWESSNRQKNSNTYKHLNQNRKLILFKSNLLETIALLKQIHTEKRKTKHNG